MLVASDAVGLGLNLNIRRLIFHSTSKFDGKVDRSLEPAEIKQVGARPVAAGVKARFGGLDFTSSESFSDRDRLRAARAGSEAVSRRGSCQRAAEGTWL